MTKAKKVIGLSATASLWESLPTVKGILRCCKALTLLLVIASSTLSVFASQGGTCRPFVCSAENNVNGQGAAASYVNLNNQLVLTIIGKPRAIAGAIVDVPASNNRFQQISFQVEGKSDLLVSLEGYDQHGSLIRESRMYQARRLVHSHCTDWCSPHLNHKGLLR